MRVVIRNQCGDRREKKREGELVLWEKPDLVGGGNEFKGISRENKSRSGDGDLSVERGRVRFRIEEVGGTKRRGFDFSFAICGCHAYLDEPVYSA